MTYHHKLSESTADQLCLAAIHFLRSHFEEATDIYKKLLLENREYLAINVYVALCYYKMDYYDVSLGVFFNIFIIFRNFIQFFEQAANFSYRSKLEGYKLISTLFRKSCRGCS